MKGILNTKDYQHFTINDDSYAVIATFEGATKAKGCLPGDEVLWDGAKCTLADHADHPMLVGTLELASRTTYGLTSRGHSIYLFIPYLRNYPPFLVGSSERDRSVHRIGIIKFNTWDIIKSQFPRGALDRLLGPSGDPVAEEIALTWLAHPWPSLRQKPVDIPAECKEVDVIRKKLTGYTFNIDPKGCKDIDDVISLEHIPDTTDWRVTITIADVACYVEEMHTVDILASTFGQTLYRDGEAICPMLPPSFSEGACSLIAGEERRGVSLSFRWRRDAPTEPVTDVHWFESLFRNDASFTYEDFERAHDLEYRAVLQEVASGLESHNSSFGIITDSHKWIEGMMKFYNVRAGAMLREAGAGILRRHSAPIMDRLQKYTAWDPALGILAQSAAEYCLADDPEVAHFGLASVAYCHATSPIRRYADLMNQRILKQLIRGNKEGLIVSISIADLNCRAKAAKKYEKNLLYLRELLSGPKEVEGRVLDLDGEKARIWIPSWQKTLNIRSADLSEGRIVRIQCAFNLLGRHWKDRIITKIVS